ncbi:MAG: cytochrome b5 domain-containing protein [Bacteroidia bacterium]|nr:cytochrome b5 domain-containing protein [Bacteroidia bacterium]
MSTEGPDTLPTYTRAQLALHNGVDREAVWVAYRGLIYAVGTSRLWRTGVHYGHWAGQDLTEELETQAPHSAASLTGKFQPIGRLV